MEFDFDFDLENYDLKDLLNLFKLPPNFNKKDMLNAKKKVLAFHPDKSGLDSKYFLFFSKAYKMILQIWDFKSKSEREVDNENTVYVAPGEDEDDEKRILLRNLFEQKKELKNVKNFNKWFNSEFEKAKIDTDDDTGYESWFRSKDDGSDKEVKKISMGEMKQNFARKRTEMCRDLVVHKEVGAYSSGIGGGAGMTLGGSGGMYDSQCGSLAFQDLRKAHTETIIPVSEDMVNDRYNYKNMNDAVEQRGKQDIAPLSLEESRKQLKADSAKQDSNATERAYNLAKQTEEASKRMSDFWGGLKLLSDK